MRKQEIARLMPGETIKRIKSAQTIVVIGPTSSGKSTLIYALVNHRIIKYIIVGIGDKRQTTIIPCNFLFDERIIKDEYFSIRINRKRFATKLIHIKILECLAKLFAMNGCDAYETVDSIDESFINNIFEPSDSAYHLGKILNEISLDTFRRAVLKVLSAIAKLENDFNSRVKVKKKEPNKTKVSVDEIRGIVMEDMWNEIPAELLEDYAKWLNSIEEIIRNRLLSLLNISEYTDEILEYSTEKDDKFRFGGNVLQGLFDPFEPYSLIIEDITLACRPREELIKMANENVPLRFCLRDSMGLNQIDMNENSIKDALDIALNCSPDSILLLISLEEHGSVISECCEVIGQKIGKAKKLDVPVNVIFTKPDIVIGNIINKEERDTVELTQEDYDRYIGNAISSVNEMVAGFVEKMPVENGEWLSIRYLEEDIDPIQRALKAKASDQITKFKRRGLYNKINCIIRDTQIRVLPKGIVEPLYITVKKSEHPAIEFKIDGSVISAEFSNMKNALTQDKAIVNGYIIKDKERIHGRSVVKYYNNLRKGLGYRTRAYVYGNFNINMKGMLNRVLLNNIPDFASLYKSEVVKTLADNIEECEIDRLIKVFDKNHDIANSAFANINPIIFEGLSSKVRMLQKIHLVFRDYFISTEKYYMVMDKVAFNLSYGNNDIRTLIDNIYFDNSLTYDETIRKMQTEFYNMFATQKFIDIVAREIGNAMTELVNKMFVII